MLWPMVLVVMLLVVPLLLLLLLWRLPYVICGDTGCVPAGQREGLLFVVVVGLVLYLRSILASARARVCVWTMMAHTVASRSQNMSGAFAIDWIVCVE